METLEKLHIINSGVGLFHTICAILAIIFGTLVLVNKKGTKKHKRLGLVYITNMLLLNTTAFGIYNFGKFSMFHAFAILSLGSIIMGIIPIIRRKGNWFKRHFYLMSWSVVGLYCAFWAEIGVRFFDMKFFWWVVMLATAATSAIGAIIINKEAKKLELN